ncbi:methylated-DNA--[protein]-cysteine S-methyltransferase [Paenibacillus sp. CMAA1364]
MNTSNNVIFWTLWTYEGWKLYIAATDKGLCYVGSQDKPFEEMLCWINKKLPMHEFTEDIDKLEKYGLELIRYFHGEMDEFSIPVELHGTPFQLAVWHVLMDIPYGETRTYTDIAITLQQPLAVRAVASAIGANPVLIAVPCHRVVGKNGSLSGYRGGLTMKSILLQHESVR